MNVPKNFGKAFQSLLIKIIKIIFLTIFIFSLENRLFHFIQLEFEEHLQEKYKLTTSKNKKHINERNFKGDSG